MKKTKMIVGVVGGILVLGGIIWAYQKFSKPEEETAETAPETEEERRARMKAAYEKRRKQMTETLGTGSQTSTLMMQEPLT